MSYLALARKYRPKNFSELVGQSHVVRALTNALDNDRLHHAFLFTGTRGVGKTTIARIFAKSINCETGTSATPCGECHTCLEIDQGRFVDLIEIDAASRTKVEDTRELLDNVQYAPTRGRYKVYLIDEVHMLSGSSFNALLKTLEEPPPHVKFLLATTDPQKIPVTILSRCLQFNLRRLPVDLISDHLESVMQSEALQAEPAAIKQLARSADGSLRDALSLLDQAIAFSNGQVSLQSVDEMLGTVKSDKVIALLSALATQKSELAITLVHDIAKEAADIEVVFEYLIGVLHGLALYQQFPQAGVEALMSYNVEKHQADELIKVFCAEDLQLFYQIAVLGNRDLIYVPDKSIGLEMTILRMLAFRPATAATISDTSSAAPVTSESVTRFEQQQQPDNNTATDNTSNSLTTKEIENNKPGVAEKFAPEAPTALQTLRIDADWPEIVKLLPISGVDKELAQNCAVKSFNGTQVDLIATPASAPLASKERINRIEKTLSTMQGRQIKINIEIAESDLESPRQIEEREQQEKQAQAKQAIESDQNVKSLMSAFDADINLNSIKPIET